MVIDTIILEHPQSRHVHRQTRPHPQARLQNVHNNCERLTEWTAIEKDANGLVFAPYSNSRRKKSR